MQVFDVAVIGGGPSGASAAITLAKFGYGVLLVDRAVFPRDKLCGDFINPVKLADLARAERQPGRTCAGTRRSPEVSFDGVQRH